MAALHSDDGLVVASDQRAAEAGATMLARGGNAVDAIVATAFAISVTEQFLSGLGGGAWIVGRHGRTGERFVVEGPIAAPAAARADMYALADLDESAGMYGWQRTVGDENISGARSIGVPGQVAALCELHERMGRLELATVLAPAIALAADGHEVDWLASALTSARAPELQGCESTAAIYLPGGLPLRGPVLGAGDWLVQPALACTLQAVGEGGATAFYEGDIGAVIASAVQAEGGVLTAADLAGYRASWGEPARADLGEVTLYGSLFTGFPTMVQMLQLVRALRQAGAEPPALVWARAMDRAFADRFTFMSTDPDSATPWDELMSEAAAREFASGVTAGPSGVPATTGSGCTSHMSAVDREGTTIALTQTILDFFGSRYLEPSTGVLLNDGMMYFDPTPGRPSSIRAGLPGLSAVCPVLAERDGAPIAAVGGAGGRKIITAVAQVLDRVLGGEALDLAIAAPRLHVESGEALIDPSFGDETSTALRTAGYSATLMAEGPTTFHYARPSGVARVGTGQTWGAAADERKPYGVAAGWTS